MFLQTDLQFFATSYQNTNARWFFEQQGILMRRLCYLIRLGQMRQLCDLGRLVPMRQLCHTGRKNGFTSVCQGVQMWCKFGALNLN